MLLFFPPCWCQRSLARSERAIYLLAALKVSGLAVHLLAALLKSSRVTVRNQQTKSFFESVCFPLLAKLNRRLAQKEGPQFWQRKNKKKWKRPNRKGRARQRRTESKQMVSVRGQEGGLITTSASRTTRQTCQEQHRYVSHTTEFSRLFLCPSSFLSPGCVFCGRSKKKKKKKPQRRKQRWQLPA